MSTSVHLRIGIVRMALGCLTLAGLSTSSFAQSISNLVLTPHTVVSGSSTTGTVTLTASARAAA